jgi:hypothetical protein
MTRLLRRKALTTSEPDAMRRKAISFLALAKVANKQVPAVSVTAPKPPIAPSV